MKTSELITILNETLAYNGDQNLVIMVNGKRFAEIEVYTDDEEELYLEGYEEGE